MVKKERKAKGNNTATKSKSAVLPSQIEEKPLEDSNSMKIVNRIEEYRIQFIKDVNKIAAKDEKVIFSIEYSWCLMMCYFIKIMTDNYYEKEKSANYNEKDLLLELQLAIESMNFTPVGESIPSDVHSELAEVVINFITSWKKIPTRISYLLNTD